MRRLLVTGLNHTTATLDVRERLAFASDAKKEALARFRAAFPDAEVVLLSTCNRVELYVSRSLHGHPREDEMASFLAQARDVDPAAVAPHLYHKSQRDAVDHLFTVAASLDSMVLGETQILGQVRDAYDLARECGATGPVLNPMFQRALAVGKQVMSQTPLGEGRLSVASVAVDYAKQIFESLGDKTVLCIGAGEMAALVLQGFAALSPKRLMVANRDLARGQALAEKFNGQGVPLEQLTEHLVAADVVISSTGAPHPIITRATFDRGLLKKRRYRPLFLIDIALPRDIEPAVAQLDSVYLYNIDDLQQVVSTTQAQRAGSVEAARKIVLAGIDDFLAALRQRQLGPAIDALYKRYHEVAREEVARTLGKLPALTEEQHAHLDELARRIVNKLLHDPVQTLRSANSDQGPTAPYLYAMQKLFKLEAEDPGAQVEPPTPPGTNPEARP